MQALKPLDFAYLVAQDICAICDIDACATPIPENLGDALPLAVVYNVGGSRVDLTVDRAALSVDVYAATPADAMSWAAVCCAACAAFPDYSGGAVQWYQCDVNTLPYDNPDPRHPTIPRVTFVCDLYAHPALVEF